MGDFAIHRPDISAAMNAGDLVLGGAASGNTQQIEICDCAQRGIESFGPFGVAGAVVMFPGDGVGGKRGSGGVGAHDAMIA